MSKFIYGIIILTLFVAISSFLVISSFNKITSKSSLSRSLRVVSVVRKRQKDQLGDIDDIIIKFSSPLAIGNLLPRLSVPIKGSWSQKTPTTLEFKPDDPDGVLSKERVVIPAGIRSQNGAQLKNRVEKKIKMGSSKVLRLQESLADMGYLPVRFTKSSIARKKQVSLAKSSSIGKFHWRWQNTFGPLKQQWKAGVYNFMTKGAVMSFERTHSMIVNSTLSSTLYSAIEKAKDAGSKDPDKYGYVFVDEKEPETLKVYENNKLVYSSLANTGMDNSTPIGTWPIYLRNLSQTLRGTYPNGTPYVIPNVRYINYFNGNFAVHGFIRSSYGWPQSAGCVELPEAAASKVWNYLHYGTLVTVAKN